MDKDRIFRDPQHQLVDFAFDDAVASVFTDMIRRSVPAYETVVPLTGLIAARHLAGVGVPGARTTIRPANLAGTAAVAGVSGTRKTKSGNSETFHSEIQRLVGMSAQPPAADADTVAKKVGGHYNPETLQAESHGSDEADAANRKKDTAESEPRQSDYPDCDPGDTQASNASPTTALVFDLGCSLGATTLALLRQLGNSPCRIVAVDNSQSMLDRAAEQVADDRVEFRLQDIRETDVSGAQVIFMNYALQFLPPTDRPTLLKRFREQMAPGGLLVLSEKIAFADVGEQEFYTDTHLAYKKANGYSDMEISQKRSALENVMIVDTEEAHSKRLRAAGFAQVKTWFRCLNWASFLAWNKFF